MAVAQGINTRVKRVKQSGLGVAGSAGSQLVRRVTATFNKTTDTYTSAEIASHQQSTGATQGVGATTGALNCELSPGTYALEFSALLRKAQAATAAITSVGLTIGAATGVVYPLTRAAGSWLTDGVKIGDVIRITVGSMNAANLSKNLLVTNISSATVASVIALNDVALFPEGPIAGNTVTVIGKKVWVPTTGHTSDYFTVERWFPDVPASEVYRDVKVASAALTLPATGIATVNFDMPGLARIEGAAEVLTSPTAESGSEVLTAVQGKVVVNGVVTAVTSANVTINGTVTPGEAEVGSSSRSDHNVGRVMVSGSFSAKFGSTVLQAIRTAQTPVSLILVAANNATGLAEFVTIVMPTVKIFSDEANDGETEIIRSYSFTAQYTSAGGAALASHQTIVSIQDSLAA